VLDLGCGPATIRASSPGTLAPRGCVVAVDYSAAMVAEARQRTTDPNLPLLEGDATKRPEPLAASAD
jgi:ubiquinone/menaquinone biosynthesis C-methylase UbiE